jgi:undecaprenyl-diphosphatase
VFDYQPFSLEAEFTSLPSGHATTVFAAAVAITALWPRTGILMWPLAVTIALSRVLVLAHNPSDVIAGAIVGIIGALVVKRWFALRALVFSFDQVGKGLVKPMRGRPRARSAVRQVG